MPPINPCQYKPVCKTCKIVAADKRPEGCQALRCKEYTPCQGCGANLEMQNGSICAQCRLGTKPPEPELEAKTKKPKKENLPVGELPTLTEDEFIEGSIDSVIATAEISTPGLPPVGLNVNQAEYYNRRWEEFTGYYRDPAAYFTVHMMILQELAIGSTTSKIIRLEGDYENDKLLDKLNKKKIELVKMLTELKKQLPEREAREQSDDEKSISGIYESYVKEKGLRAIGKVSRVLTADAEALNTQMVFKLNLRQLFERLGYKTVDIEEVFDRYKVDIVNNFTPAQLLEFLGYPLNERYAINSESAGDISESGDGSGVGMDEDVEPIDLELTGDPDIGFGLDNGGEASPSTFD